MLYRPESEDTALLFYMEWPFSPICCLALTERLLWHGLRRSGVRDASRVCFDYETYYSGDLCVEFKSCLNDFEIQFE